MSAQNGEVEVTKGLLFRVEVKPGRQFHLQAGKIRMSDEAAMDMFAEPPSFTRPTLWRPNFRQHASHG